MATGAASAPAMATEKTARGEILSTEIALKGKPGLSQSPEEDEARWRRALPLPCQLTVELPLSGVKVRDFLELRPGAVIGSRWRITRDVPLRANGVLISWGELEASGNRLALRVTELG